MSTILQKQTDACKMTEPTIPVEESNVTKTSKEVENPLSYPAVRPTLLCLVTHPTTSKACKIKKRNFRELNLSNSVILTPKTKNLYLTCRRYFCKLVKLAKKMQEEPPHIVLQKLMHDKTVKSVANQNITEFVALLLQSQFKHLKLKPWTLDWQQWSVDNKINSLSIYIRSAPCYKLLRRLFCLPSVVKLKAFLNRIPLKCGINHQIFQLIQRKTKNQLAQDNLCILAFDKMRLRKNWKHHGPDIVEQDQSSRDSATEPVTHVLLFMAIGIQKSWKQPLAFYFCGDYMAEDRLSSLIKEVLDASLQAGLCVMATVCGNYSVNIKTLNSLGSSVAEPYFNFKGHEVVTILDPPHLLQCFRDIFLKCDIEYTYLKVSDTDKTPITGVAKWSHIKEFYEKDNAETFVFAPALSKLHVEPDSKQKLEVSLAREAFSHKVAVGILTQIAKKVLPSEAATTAMLIEKMDQLSDALYSGTLSDAIDGDTPNSGTKYSGDLTLNSPHLTYFKEMKQVFESMKFIGALANPAPPQEGFIRTLNAVERLFTNVHKTHKIKSIATRQLNKDPLENCFDSIRRYGGSEYPNTVQFVETLKTVLLNNWVVYCSCEDEETQIKQRREPDYNVTLVKLKSLLSNRKS